MGGWGEGGIEFQLIGELFRLLQFFVAGSVGCLTPSDHEPLKLLFFANQLRK